MTYLAYPNLWSSVSKPHLFVLFFFLMVNNICAQVYPPDTNMSPANYNPPTPLPGYLAPFTEENFGNKVTRVSNLTDFGGDNASLRHDYSKRQVWNSDGSYILLAGNNPKLLDGSNYTLLATLSSIGNMGFSNTNRLMSFHTRSNSNYFEKRLLNESNYTVSTVFHRTFSDYNILSHNSSEANVSADDKYIALYGTKPSTGNDCWVVVYDIELDTIYSETNLGVAFSSIDWISMSQSGDYVVVLFNSDGSGSNQGVKSYDKDMNFIAHVTNLTAHGDLGYDTNGNEVFVSNGSNYVRSNRLDGVGTEIKYVYVSGGHVSCRNINRPGWAYITDHGQISQPSDYDSFREIFAVKLDGKPNGVLTVNRFTKHYSDANYGYYHEPQAVASPDGSKVLFASNMGNTSVEAQNYAFAFVVEAPQNPNEINANAGQDQNICEGTSATLSATGGTTYEWSTGETTASITVTPNTTTTYTVTAYDASGTNSDTDDVTITVNPIPTANAGTDVETCLGTPVTLKASGGTSYIWNTGATTASISVNPNATTTYSVEVIQNNCSSTDDVTVTVNPLPITNAGTDVTINSGENTTLTATGADSYLWSTGETTASITVSPTVDTTYTVIGAINNCESSDTVTVFLVDNSVTANAGDDTVICNGNNTTLTATGGTDYLWNTGATTASITVSPNTTTTYTVTVSNQFDSDTDDVVVTVNPKPTANAGTNVTISEGENTTLTASGGDSYVWSTGETTASIVVNPSTTTTYTVIALLNGCEDSDDVIVTVETAQVIADAGSDQNICEGNSTTLTAYGGTDYLWNTGETTQSIEVSPNSTTNYTVIVSNDSSSDTDDVTVAVNPVPEVAVSDDDTILEGNYITLSASGANNYEWSNGATQPNIAVSPSVTTTYVVTGYINNCYDVKDVTVSVVEQVVADAGEDKSICAGTEVMLEATSTGGEDYLWNTGETTQNIMVSPQEDTLYTVIVSNSLDSDADEIMVTVDACEEEIIPEDQAFIFEAYIDSRRSNDILNIKLAGLKDECELYLFDISGKLIHTDIFDGNDGQEITRTINTSLISDGVYIIKVTERDNVHSKSIVIR